MWLSTLCSYFRICLHTLTRLQWLTSDIRTFFSHYSLYFELTKLGLAETKEGEKKGDVFLPHTFALALSKPRYQIYDMSKYFPLSSLHKSPIEARGIRYPHPLPDSEPYPHEPRSISKTSPAKTPLDLHCLHVRSPQKPGFDFTSQDRTDRVKLPRTPEVGRRKGVVTRQILGFLGGGGVLGGVLILGG